MSKEKTFFGAIIAGLLSIFKNNWKDWVKKLWNKQVPDEIKPEVTTIVEIIERVKTFVDGPGLDLITWAIPGDKDDKAVEWLRSIFRSTTAKYGLTEKKVEDYERGDLQTLASEMTAQYLGMPYGQAAITVQGAFENLVNIPKEEANA